MSSHIHAFWIFLSLWSLQMLVLYNIKLFNLICYIQNKQLKLFFICMDPMTHSFKLICSLICLTLSISERKSMQLNSVVHCSLSHHSWVCVHTLLTHICGQLLCMGVSILFVSFCFELFVYFCACRFFSDQMLTRLKLLYKCYPILNFHKTFFVIFVTFSHYKNLIIKLNFKKIVGSVKLTIWFSFLCLLTVLSMAGKWKTFKLKF